MPIATKYTVRVAAIAPANAPPVSAKSPNDENHPKVMTDVAPTLAPDEMPNKYGSASGFLTRLWIATPASARPAPTMAANAPRGARKSHTTESSDASGVPVPPKCARMTDHTWLTSYWAEPNVVEAIRLMISTAAPMSRNSQSGARRGVCSAGSRWERRPNETPRIRRRDGVRGGDDVQPLFT